MKLLVLLALLVPLSAHASQRFYNPEYRGYRLDACLVFEGNCGAPAALAFCQRKGFQGVNGFNIARNVGTTMTIGDGKMCARSWPPCDGFEFIECF
ncbi:hypothetical protein [Sorangium sp. So ce1182]|uniref:hypothetical protein n=1 Tax=Sorangium sp. So ce1182 TaxID=3133334 RepID=UPI003F5FC353